MEKSVGVNIAFDRLAVLCLQNIMISLSYFEKKMLQDCKYTAF